MKKKSKIAFLGLGLVMTLFAVSGCTANFCTEKEKARIMYAFEPGISTFYVEGDPLLESIKNDSSKKDCLFQLEENNAIYQFVDFNFETNLPDNNELLSSVISSAKNSGIYLPTFEFYKTLDKDVFKLAIEENNNENAKAEEQQIFDHKYPTINLENTTISYSTLNINLNDLLYDYGYVKFYDAETVDYFNNYTNELNSLRQTDRLGYEVCPSVDFISIYRSALDAKVNNYRSCITTVSGEFGNYGQMNKPVFMDATTWGDAWGKGGHIIEGLIVYPVAWLLDTFANLFAKTNMSFNDGVPQILSLIIVTIIVRLFIFLVTIKSTLSQQKMTSLQPELMKIQQKYPNANTNQSEKQRLSEEQMRLYKKNGVNPLSSLLVLIVQFPVFIGVWGAMTGSAVLSTGSFLNLGLSTSILDCLKMGPTNHPGWWTALVLILLMSAGQFFSMKVPQWIQKAKAKKISRLAKNPAEKQQNKTANIISYVMLIMIIFMGFTLPAAMGVYWLIGALFSLAQSLIMELVINKKKHK